MRHYTLTNNYDEYRHVYDYEDDELGIRSIDYGKWFRFVDNARAMSSTKTMSWITRMVDKGLVSVGGRILSGEKAEAYKQGMSVLVEALDSFYGRLWDMHVELLPNAEGRPRMLLAPFILFPDETITNSKGKTHRIRDLIVSFDIGITGRNNERRLYLHTPTGIRAAFYSNELQADGFLHPHLRKANPRHYSSCLQLTDFCTGSGEINTMMADMLTRDHAVEDYHMFFMFLKTFVSWESIEGTPFHHLHKLIGRENRRVINPSNREVETLIDYMESLLYDDILSTDGLNYFIRNGKYAIRDDKGLETFLKRFDRRLSNTMLCKRNEGSGEYLSFIREGSSGGGDNMVERGPENTIRDLRGRGVPFTYISGERKYIRFLPNPHKVEKDDIKEFKMHPKVKYYAKRQLEQKLYENSIRRKAIGNNGTVGTSEALQGQM